MLVVATLVYALNAAPAFSAGASYSAPDKVRVVRLPDGAIQPDAAIGSDGSAHLIYFKGDPMDGDAYPGQDGNRKHPAIARNDRGDVMLA